MDPLLRRHYLHALGVQVWRPRLAPLTDSGLGTRPQRQPEPVPAPTPLAHASAEAPVPPARVRPELDWEALATEVAGCRACGLCQTRTQTVFGVGDRQAKLMLIGEAPGVDEDRAGEPFVGRAGRLLNLMLAAIGLSREQVYIANILKCHPPGNRDPSPEETLRCEPFLQRQIELVGPKLLLAVGRVAAQTLLRSGTAVGRLRGQWFEFGDNQIPLTVTYHPAYLLRSPDQKALAWQDLQRVARRLRDLQNIGAGAGGVG
jgi:uracil-DNA glycosylase